METKEISSVPELIEEINEFDTLFWFRGQRKSSWPLQPSAFRGEERQALEAHLTQRFKSKAPLFDAKCPHETDYKKWLPLMQHYGLPTRLLDWSESPLVALFFAIQSDENENGNGDNKQDDAALYSLDCGEMNKSLHESPETILLDSTGYEKVHDICGRAFNMKTSRNGIHSPIAVFAIQRNYRMFNQMSCFTLHDMPTPLDEIPSCDVFLKKYIIKQTSFSRIRRDLGSLGIRRSSLFPDLDNLAAELKQIKAIPI